MKNELHLSSSCKKSLHNSHTPIPDAGASNVETGSDSSLLPGIIGGVFGGVALLGAIGAGLYYFKVRAKKPPASAGGGQAQGGVTLSAPADLPLETTLDDVL